MEEAELRPKSSGRRIIEALLVFSVFCILLAILFPPHPHSKENYRKSGCQSNLKQIMLAMKQYLQDYDEGYPLAKTVKPAFGWADAVQLHTQQTEEIFQCPSEENAPNTDPSESGYSDYWFNSRLYGLKESQVWDGGLTIILGEGDSGDASSHLLQIPMSWRKDEKSPLYRHLDGANYAFADGHVKWFRATQWRSNLDLSHEPTLTLQIKPIY